MIIIDSETVVVYNYNELKTVLEGNNTYNLIYFGDNITLTGGITILPSKSKITIDGTYNNIRYTYTDYNSSSPAQTIHVNSASSINVTLQNIDVLGRNYYGVICIYDLSTLSNAVVTYNNIKYNGPQLAFNPYSSLFIIDSDITIQPGASPANEVAETRNLTLGGNVQIYSTSMGVSTFWFRNVVGGIPPYFKILPDANVNIIADNYLCYISTTYINMTFGANSVSNIRVHYGMGYVDSHLYGSVLIDNNAKVNITQDVQFGGNSTWNIYGEFRMNNGSSLKMISDYIGSITNYSLRFSNSTASFVLNNPESIIIYNTPATAIRAASTIPYSLNISQYNRWTTLTPIANAGDIYDIPQYSWYKTESVGNMTVSGNITTTTTTITSNNFTASELLDLPALSNFLINNTKVLSFGRPSLTINPITDLQTDITGTTTPNADIRISYDSVVDYVQADSNGDFTYSYPSPLPIGTNISFVSNYTNSFLYRFRTVQIIFPGDISITSATEKIFFSTTPYQNNPTLFKRITPLSVVVDDSRINPAPWKLYAYINNQLTNERNNVLTDGLVYINEIKDMTVMSDTPILVYEHPGLTSGTTNISWSDDEGMILQLNIVPIVLNTTYSTNINWHLEQ